jgi:hypothetical protein
MRRILIDWLVEVAGEFKYCTETLHLCVSYLDRALATLTIINSRNLQLVGIVCLWIACKYEEITPPSVKMCVHVCDKIYTTSEVTSFVVFG